MLERSLFEYLIVAIYVVGCVIGTIATPRTEAEAEAVFCEETRPLGLWGAARQRLESSEALIGTEDRWDLPSTFVALAGFSRRREAL